MRDLIQAHDTSLEQLIQDLIQARDTGCMRRHGGHPGHEESPAPDRFFPCEAKDSGVVPHHGSAFLHNDIDGGMHAVEASGHRHAMAERSEGSRREASALMQRGEFAAQ